jgi:hypothetical protein
LVKVTFAELELPSEPVELPQPARVTDAAATTTADKSAIIFFGFIIDFSFNLII